MKSTAPGTLTSTVEIVHVTTRGIRLSVDGRELFASFRDFPWFEDATIRQLTEIERPAPDHLRWPALDVDLEVDSLLHPKKYPLVSRARPSRASVVSEPPQSPRRSPTARRAK